MSDTSTTADAASSPSPAASGVVVEADGGVRVVRLNRPAADNRIDRAMHERLEEVWPEIASDPDARCVVLTGTGDFFSAGGDVGWVDELTKDQAVWDAAIYRDRAIVTAMRALPLPIVAAVNGPAVSLACSLVLACDLAVFSSSAYIVDRHVTVGLPAGDGGAALLPMLIPTMRAKHYLFTGQPITAEAAMALGLAVSVHSPESTLAAALDLARTLAAQPAAALQVTKRAINRHADAGVEAAGVLASEAERLTMDSPEFLEILAARQRPVAGASPAPPSVRIAPLDPAEDTPELAAALSQGPFRSLSDDRFRRTLARNAGLYEPLAPFIGHLLVGLELPARVRELMILRVAWRCQCSYVWQAHVRAARRVGVSDPDITSVAGATAGGLPGDLDRAAVAAVDELMAGSRISDHTWSLLAADLSPSQLVEVPILIGAYVMVCYAQSAFLLGPLPSVDSSGPDDPVVGLVSKPPSG